ncbi:hypothetical protein, partial [Escherichia coli]|uniref:hypothetical protein n=1 Tax=Escherichia coli TaxID=562 RepID=UPI001BB29032
QSETENESRRCENVPATPRQQPQRVCVRRATQKKAERRETNKGKKDEERQGGEDMQEEGENG